MTSRAPGGWSPYGGPVPDEPAPARREEPRRPPYVLATLVILEFFVIVGMAGWLYWKYQHDKTHPPTGPAPVAGVKSLSHEAVESYIDSHFGTTGVMCNDGANFPMTSNGATFPCAAQTGSAFTVTVTNKSTGDYTVRIVQPVKSAPPSTPHQKHKHKKANK